MTATRLRPVLVVLLLAGIIGGCRSRPSYLDAPKDTAPKGVRPVKVFIYYPDRGALTREDHEVPRSENLPLTTLRELFRLTPNNNWVKPKLPKGVRVLGVVVKDGRATVNFDRKILEFDATPEEQTLAVMAIVSTLTGFKEIDSVVFQVEGRQKGKIGGKDVERFWGSVTLEQQPWKA